MGSILIGNILEPVTEVVSLLTPTILSFSCLRFKKPLPEQIQAGRLPLPFQRVTGTYADSISIGFKNMFRGSMLCRMTWRVFSRREELFGTSG